MSSFAEAVIVDNAILFVGTVLLFLMMTAFPEVLKGGGLSNLKRFFF